jgi:hypothetical protein
MFGSFSAACAAAPGGHESGCRHSAGCSPQRVDVRTETALDAIDHRLLPGPDAGPVGDAIGDASAQIDEHHRRAGQ